MAEASGLRLLAEDEADLAVMSAALQDAIAQVGDVLYEPKTRRVTIAFNRYCWEAGKGQRVRTALQIGSVLDVQSRMIRRDRRDAVLELLAITFVAGDAPGGTLTLSFAGGGDFRLHVECVDAVLADVSHPWPTPRTPTHDI